jgi:hypothetical protein
MEFTEPRHSQQFVISNKANSWFSNFGFVFTESRILAEIASNFVSSKKRITQGMSPFAALWVPEVTEKKTIRSEFTHDRQHGSRIIWFIVTCADLC